MTRRRKKRAEISVSVNGQDCGDSVRGDFNSADELDAIGRTFATAAEFMRLGTHGSIECEKNLAHIGIDFGGPYNERTGLPVLSKIRIRKGKHGKAT